MKTQTCLSCGNELTGNYCNDCGEKVIRKEDRTLKHFLGEFINALTFADSKFWRTIKYILLRPGKFSRDFVDGKRKAYMKPVSVFFFANLIYFLFPLFSAFNTTLETQTRKTNFIHSSIASEMVYEKITKRGISFEEYAKAYNSKTSELSKLLLIVMVFLLAPLLFIIHNPKKHLLSDHVVISLELMTFVLLFAVQLQGGIVHLLNKFNLMSTTHTINEAIVSSVVVAMLFYFFIKVEIHFYGVRKWRVIFNSILCFLSFTVVFYAYRAILFFATFWSV